MIGCSYSRLWRLPRRQNPTVRLHPSQPFYRHISVDHQSKHPYPEPTSSQRVRFALTGSANDGFLKPELDQHLREIFSESWPLNSPPPPLWSFYKKETRPRPDQTVFLRNLRREVRSLRHLQVFIERNIVDEKTGLLLQTDRCDLLAHALERCQRHNSYGEILCSLNSIISRLERLRVPLSDHISVLGMHYASLAFSAPALHRHLQGYFQSASGPLDLESSLSLVNALLSSFYNLSFQNAEYDTSKMIGVITGEIASVTHSLHSVLCWSNPEFSTDLIGDYLSLLVITRSDAILQELWDHTLKNISPDSSVDQFHSVYSCVKALADAGNLSRALSYITQVSKRANNSLPGISSFGRLDHLLSAPALSAALPQLAGEEESIMMLELQAQHLEKRLGISWHPDKSIHTSVADSNAVATENPLFTIDGDSYGYGSRERLVAEIQALGCSKSTTDLQKIPDLLDDYDSDLIPVSIPLSKSADSTFFWIPLRSPIELRASDTLPCSPKYPQSSALGLITVKPVVEIPLVIEHSLNLIPLGYLVRQQRPFHTATPELADNLEETGHIFTFDRASGQFVIVYVGKGYGLVDTHTEWQPRFLPFGLSGIATAQPLRNNTLQNNSRALEIRTWGYKIDVDRGPDLAP